MVKKMPGNAYLTDANSGGTTVYFQTLIMSQHTIVAKNLTVAPLVGGGKQESVFVGTWEQRYKFSFIIDSENYDLLVGLLKSGGVNKEYTVKIVWPKEDGSGNTRCAIGYVENVSFKFTNIFAPAYPSANPSGGIEGEMSFVVDTERLPSNLSCP